MALDRSAEYTVTDARARYPWHLVREGSRAGLRTLAVPEADGGGGADPVALCLAGEELARGDLGIAILFSQTWLYSRLLAEALDADQRARFYQPFLQDPEHVLAWRSDDGNWVWTFVVKERDGRTRLISRKRFRNPRRIARIGMMPPMRNFSIVESRSS